MTATPADLRSLSRGPSVIAIPKPRIRLGTRVLLPLAILLSAAALIAYSARATLMPSIDVWVVPVVASPEMPADGTSDAAAAQAPSTVLVQAPGWIEPNPYAVTVQALAEGVISEVLVLEGEPVAADQVVARMIDNDARLSVRLAEANFDAEKAGIERAQAELKAAEARAAEVRDEAERKRPLCESGGISEGQLARLELRLSAAEREIDAFRAAVAVAEARVKSHRVLCDEARLRFSRMEIRAPSDGVVLQRLVEPGARISMNTLGADAAMGIVRLYHPDRLQVRVDVPLADVSKIVPGGGTHAEIETEAVPGVVFKGEVIRVVPEANIQRNTVQFKVGIKDPGPNAAALKPEMLARVRFLGKGAASTIGANPHAATPFRTNLASAQIQIESEEKGHVWIADHSHGTSGPVALRRPVILAQSSTIGRTDVLEGLNPGDRIIVDPPPTLREGSRIHILGEKTEPQP